MYLYGRYRMHDETNENPKITNTEYPKFKIFIVGVVIVALERHFHC